MNLHRYRAVRLLILTGILFCMPAFTPGNVKLKIADYQNLVSLKNPGPPEPLNMVNLDALGRDSEKLVPGTLFSYRGRNADSVEICASFTGWDPVPMNKGRHGVWYYFKPLSAGDSEYSYKYIVDGIYIRDPLNFSKKDDGAGSYVSVTYPPQERFNPRLTYRILGKNRVEFRHFRPRARFISVVGDFNDWNPENDVMTRGKDGVWRLLKRLPSGTYRYKLVIDGEWKADIYNSNSASDKTGDLCSVVTVK